MPLKAVIVGCGKIAGGFNESAESAVLTHAMAFRRLDAQLAGCVDHDPVRAARFAERWQIAHHGADLEAILREAQPDVVSLCTPPMERLMALKTILSAASVRAVLVEKPLAGTADEARLVAGLARTTGKPVLVNYCRAFDPFYQRLGDAVGSGSFGPLREGVARYYGPAASNASHWLERVMAMFGLPQSAARLSGSQEAPVFEAVFEGARVLFLPSRGFQYSPFELDLLFEKARVRVVDSECRAEYFSSRPDPRFAGYFNLSADRPRFDSAPSHESIALSVGALLGAAEGKAGNWRDLLERSTAVVELLEKLKT